VLSLFRAENGTAHLNSSHEAQRRTAFDPQQSKNRKDKKPRQASEKTTPIHLIILSAFALASASLLFTWQPTEQE